MNTPAANRIEQEPGTQEVTFTVSTTLVVPVGSEIAYAQTGIPVGIRLPGGKVVKPFVSYETVASDDEDPEEVSEDDLMQLDVFVATDHERTFKGLD